MNQAKIYVGNLAYSTSEDDVRAHFGQFGTIEEVNLIIDRATGRSKGFGFVTFSSNQEGQNALEANGNELDGRKLNVNTAKENNSRDRGGRGGSY